jgi:cyanophycinase-like exopeptidase
MSLSMHSFPARLAALLAALLAAFALALPTAALAAKSPQPAKIYFRIGNTSDATGVATEAGTVLAGGGTDVDAAFKWLCTRAAGGDFLVIRATGTDAYNKYVQRLCPGLNSVATLIIASTADANSALVSSAIRDAEVVWIAGGDQSLYITYWENTAVQTQLDAHIAANEPIGGTSAGMAVLTEFIYPAFGAQGATSSETLANPYNQWVMLGSDFVDIAALAGTISDTHFVTRDRMGRTLGFMCRLYADNWTRRPRSIAADEGAALLIDGNGKGSIVANPKTLGRVYFIAGGAPEVCQAGTPLTYLNVGVRRFNAGATSIDVAGWPAGGGTAYTVTAAAGVLSSTQPGGSVY